jgi:hypothetical protein
LQVRRGASTASLSTLEASRGRPTLVDNLLDGRRR